jgi:predicted RNA binding protein YcfA (HicA-like mRNA interferase family)
MDKWIKHAQKGSHCQYRHLIKKGKVTVPHPRKDFPYGTLKNILKQAGLTEKLKVHEDAVSYFYT